MSGWWKKWSSTVAVWVAVLGVATAVALTTVGTVAVVQGTSPAKPAVAAPAKAKAPRAHSPQPRDGGDICDRFSSYQEAKRHWAAHPGDRADLSWDGDRYPCEDYLDRWGDRRDG